MLSNPWRVSQSWFRSKCCTINKTRWMLALVNLGEGAGALSGKPTEGACNQTREIDRNDNIRGKFMKNTFFDQGWCIWRKGNRILKICATYLPQAESLMGACGSKTEGNHWKSGGKLKWKQDAGNTQPVRQCVREERSRVIVSGQWPFIRMWVRSFKLCWKKCCVREEMYPKISGDKEEGGP